MGRWQANQHGEVHNQAPDGGGQAGARGTHNGRLREAGGQEPCRPFIGRRLEGMPPILPSDRATDMDPKLA